ncbi:MAG: META domain-containing protein [Candidatus Nanopelagicales bacterium]
MSPLLGAWQITALLPGPRPVAQPATIAFETQRLFLYAGCNRGVGAYRLEDSTLVAGPVALTMKFCPDMRVEQHLCAALSQPLTLDIQRDRLVARGASLGFEAVRGGQD